MKKTSVTETTYFEIRAEIFNLFNRGRYGLPNMNVDDGTSASRRATVTSPAAPHSSRREVRVLVADAERQRAQQESRTAATFAPDLQF